MIKPTKGKLLLKFVEVQKSKIAIVDADGKPRDPNKIEGKFYIEQVGKDCDDELQVGQEVTLREHAYKINVTKKEQADKGEYYLITDQSEVWGIE